MIEVSSVVLVSEFSRAFRLSCSIRRITKSRFFHSSQDDALTVDQSFVTINTNSLHDARGEMYGMRPAIEAGPAEYGSNQEEPPEENDMMYQHRQSLKSLRSSGPDPMEEMIDTRPQAPYESSSDSDLLRISNSRTADPLEMIDSRPQAPFESSDDLLRASNSRFVDPARYSSSEDHLRSSNSTNRSNLDPSAANLGQQSKKRSFHADDIPPLRRSLSGNSGYSPSQGSDPYPPVARSRSAGRSSYPASPSNPLDKTRGHSQREMRYDSMKRSKDYSDIDGSEMSASTPESRYSSRVSASVMTDISNPTTQDPPEYSAPSSRCSYLTEGPLSRDSSRSSSRGGRKRRSATRSRDKDRGSSYPSPKNGPPSPPPNRRSAPVIQEEMSADANVPVQSISLDNLSVVSDPTFFDPEEGGRGKDSIRHKNVSSSGRRHSYHELSNSDETQDNETNNGALRQSAVDTMVMEALRQAQVARDTASAEGTPSPVDAAEALRQTQAAHLSPGLTPPFAFVPQTSPLQPPPRNTRRTYLSGHSSRSGGFGSVHSFYSESGAEDENASAYDC